MATSTQMANYGSYAQLAGSAVDALGQISAGRDRKKMMEADARAVQAQANAKAKIIRKAGKAAVGQTRSGAVASGVTLSSESVMEAERQTIQNVEHDALMTIITGGSQAASLRATGGAYQSAGRNDAMESLVHGATMWARGKRISESAGVPPRDPYDEMLRSNRGMGD